MAEPRVSDGWLDCAAGRLMAAEERLAGPQAHVWQVTDTLGEALLDIGRALTTTLPRDAELMTRAAAHLVKMALDHLVRGDRGEAARCAGAAALALNSVLLERRRG